MAGPGCQEENIGSRFYTALLIRLDELGGGGFSCYHSYFYSTSNAKTTLRKGGFGKLESFIQSEVASRRHSRRHYPHRGLSTSLETSSALG